MTKVISNEVLERLENTFLYINLFIGDYNNSIDKLPQILNNKSEMKSCVTNIRNSIRKINKFIIGNKTKNELQQIYSSCNIQYIFLFVIIKLHLTTEFTIINNEILTLNYQRFNRVFEQKPQNVNLRTLEIKKKRTKAFIWRVLVSHKLLLKTADELDISITDNNETEIIKEIKFPPEFKQAGIGILNYFSDYITRKYPEDNIEVSIQQINTKVILVIKPPKGKVIPIVEDFTTFGKIVTGEEPVEKYSQDPIVIQEMHNKRKLAELEINITKRLYEVEKDVLRLKNEKSSYEYINEVNPLAFMEEVFKFSSKIVNIQNLQIGDSNVKNQNIYSNISASNIGNDNKLTANDILINSTKNSNDDLKKEIELILERINQLLKDSLNTEDEKTVFATQSNLENVKNELETVEEVDKSYINNILLLSKKSMDRIIKISNYTEPILSNLNSVKDLIESAIK